MELLVIVALVVLVGAVLLYRKVKGTDRNLDVTTGNPPANKDEKYKPP
ncbi:hypothetical protein [Nocardia bovistercoris]|uniref:Uncharacterized protein n=1 Tax=Nocardia bovistercoris TaxID=2785916 RepID=A0A931N551_9NOCA|nr:hypothetical protein [Nocardia bovistercoris]MBH0779494.1 hypothetical protein [Nocardia bovistercoris]